MKHKQKTQNELRIPKVLPFIDLVKAKLNIRVDVVNEQTLLATYERYWILQNVLGVVQGAEKRCLFKLAKKYNSFFIPFLVSIKTSFTRGILIWILIILTGSRKKRI